MEMFLVNKKRGRIIAKSEGIRKRKKKMEWLQSASVLGDKLAVFSTLSRAVLATPAFFQSCVANSNQCEGHLEAVFFVNGLRLLFARIP
jgi:hypothetical protein